MSASQIASRYAKSLLELAIDQNKTSQVKSDMEQFEQALKSRDLYLMFKSPIIHPDKKMACVKQLFEGRMDPLTIRFFDITIRKNREAILPEMALAFDEQYNEHFLIAHVKVTSAVALNAQTTEVIKSKVRDLVGADKTIEIDSKIDPSIIGGFILQYKDQLYDSSVAYQLSKLRQSFTQHS